MISTLLGFCETFTKALKSQPCCRSRWHEQSTPFQVFAFSLSGYSDLGRRIIGAGMISFLSLTNMSSGPFLVLFRHNRSQAIFFCEKRSGSVTRPRISLLCVHRTCLCNLHLQLFYFFLDINKNQLRISDIHNTVAFLAWRDHLPKGQMARQCNSPCCSAVCFLRILAMISMKLNTSEKNCYDKVIIILITNKRS